MLKTEIFENSKDDSYARTCARVPRNKTVSVATYYSTTELRGIPSFPFLQTKKQRNKQELTGSVFALDDDPTSLSGDKPWENVLPPIGVPTVARRCFKARLDTSRYKNKKEFKIKFQDQIRKVLQLHAFL